MGLSGILNAADRASSAIVDFDVAGNRRGAAVCWISENRVASTFANKRAAMFAEMVQQFVTLHGRRAMPLRASGIDFDRERHAFDEVRGCVLDGHASGHW